jgi:hypothetical protein
MTMALAATTAGIQECTPTTTTTHSTTRTTTGVETFMLTHKFQIIRRLPLPFIRLQLMIHYSCRVSCYYKHCKKGDSATCISCGQTADPYDPALSANMVSMVHVPILKEKKDMDLRSYAFVVDQTEQLRNN